ncbi:hypothetical protein [Paenibacillus sp. GCM10027626]|uniref:hypothetical protein n=1 Tax=Paenibacillus sp. GCM10027626 TaxID=3273411 RepID=UPI0036313DD5
MAKTKRGRALWSLPSRGRGTCPLCKATRIKLLYTRTKSSGTAVKVCKRCQHAEQLKIDALAE